MRDRKMPLLFEALVTLVRFDMAAWRGFRHVHTLMSAPCDSSGSSPDPSNHLETIGRVCTVVQLVCSYYPKSVMCLQRSGTIARMLKKRGVPAEVVIGIKKFPFQAHAWIEIDGLVVNDHAQVGNKYLPIERFPAGGLRVDESPSFATTKRTV